MEKINNNQVKLAELITLKVDENNNKSWFHGDLKNGIKEIYNLDIENNNSLTDVFYNEQGYYAFNNIIDDTEYSNFGILINDTDPNNNFDAFIKKFDKFLTSTPQSYFDNY